jgi:hypothetical protein
VSIDRGSAEAEGFLDQIYPAAPGTAPGKSVFDSHLRLESVSNGVSTLRAQFSRGLEVLMAGVGLLLLMACANVAGLLLARSAVRAQEMGIRLALGASPGRIVRQFLTEGLLLALLGGCAGTVLIRACLPLLVHALPPIRDRGAVLQSLAVHVGIDLRVLGFAMAITLLTTVLFALSPAVRGARADVASVLKAGRTTTRRLLPRNLIVMVQVAVCTLILMGAALLIGTLERMRSMNPGFDRDHVVTFTIDPGLKRYKPEQGRALSKALLEKASGLPGVGAASIASRALMRGTGVKATFEQQYQRRHTGLFRDHGHARSCRPRFQLVRPESNDAAQGDREPDIRPALLRGQEPDWRTRRRFRSGPRCQSRLGDHRPGQRREVSLASRADTAHGL